MLLTLHIAGGILSLFASGAGFWGSLTDDKRCRWLSVALPLLFLWQTLTGIMLLTQGASVVRMCASGIVYLALMGWVEWRLLQRRPVREEA